MFTRALAGAAAALVAAAAVAGCGSSSNSTSSTSTTPTTGKALIVVSQPLAAQVPADLRSKGSLTVAADATYPPNEFVASDGHTVIGMDADLAQALGQVLNLKFNVTNATFDTIIPGIAAGKYDVGMSSMTDTKEREKTLTFVDYYLAGTSFYTKVSAPANVSTLADLCGKTVAVEKGTTQQTDATTQDAQCRKSGKPGVTVLAFPDQNSTNLALASGRAQVAMADSPVAAYQVKQSNGQFALVGQTYGKAPYGVALPKNSPLAQPILGALKQLIASGAYNQILTKWGIQSGAITTPAINGATS